MLACDGVYDVLSDQDVVDVVVTCLSDGAAHAARTLAQRAIDCGSADNVTVVVTVFRFENVWLCASTQFT